MADTTGLYPGEFITLAQKVGLYKLQPNAQVTEADLFSYLRAGGPIWSAGYWFGCGHIIVVTGVDKGAGLLQRPRPGREEEGHAQVVQRETGAAAGCMMVKDPGAY